MDSGAESEILPDSQDLELRTKATSDAPQKKTMKISCARCFQGDDLGRNIFLFVKIETASKGICLDFLVQSIIFQSRRPTIRLAAG